MKTNLRSILFTLTLFFGVYQVNGQGTGFLYQGQLRDDGNPANGTYDFTFSLFHVSNGGSAVVGPVTNNAVKVTNGLFTVLLDFGEGVFNGESNWLQVGVQTNDGNSFTFLAPRQQLRPTPYAIYAEGANAAGITGLIPTESFGGTYGNQVILGNAANQFNGAFTGDGAGLTNVNATTLSGLAASDFWRTTGNSGTIAGVNFVGTTDNQPLELKVNAERGLRLEPNVNGTPNFIAGSQMNSVLAGLVGATIGGGDQNTISYLGRFATIGGGRTNYVRGQYSTISGGVSNSITSGYNVSAPFAASIGGGSGNQIYGSGVQGCTVGGGIGNVMHLAAGYISEEGCTISGGIRNGISDSISGSTCATIGGGQGNNIGDGGWYSTIAGGFGNWMGGDFGQNGTIGGGYSNHINSAWDGTIGGGFNNGIYFGAHDSVVGGGANNVISYYATSSVVGGGQANQIGQYASWAVVPGGCSNNAAASYSFAAGFQAQATNQGAFVWADSQDSAFASTVDNQVSFRCAGGVSFTSASGGDNQTVSWTPGSASWSFSSDCNLKDRFAEVNSELVLEKVLKLPILEWSYKGYPQRHIGVMAQDFHELFPLNESDTTLNDADLHGVELAAIKGLDRKLKEKDTEIQNLQKQLDDLQTMLKQLAAKK